MLDSTCVNFGLSPYVLMPTVTRFLLYVSDLADRCKPSNLACSSKYVVGQKVSVQDVILGGYNTWLIM